MTDLIDSEAVEVFSKITRRGKIPPSIYSVIEAYDPADVRGEFQSLLGQALASNEKWKAARSPIAYLTATVRNAARDRLREVGTQEHQFPISDDGDSQDFLERPKAPGGTPLAAMWLFAPDEERDLDEFDWQRLDLSGILDPDMWAVLSAHFVKGILWKDLPRFLGWTIWVEHRTGEDTKTPRSWGESALEKARRRERVPSETGAWVYDEKRVKAAFGRVRRLGRRVGTAGIPFVFSEDLGGGRRTYSFDEEYSRQVVEYRELCEDLMKKERKYFVGAREKQLAPAVNKGEHLFSINGVVMEKTLQLEVERGKLLRISEKFQTVARETEDVKGQLEKAQAELQQELTAAIIDDRAPNTAAPKDLIARLTLKLQSTEAQLVAAAGAQRQQRETVDGLEIEIAAAARRDMLTRLRPQFKKLAKLQDQLLEPAATIWDDILLNAGGGWSHGEFFEDSGDAVEIGLRMRLMEAALMLKRHVANRGAV